MGKIRIRDLDKFDEDVRTRQKIRRRKKDKPADELDKKPRKRIRKK